MALRLMTVKFHACIALTYSSNTSGLELAQNEAPRFAEFGIRACLEVPVCNIGCPPAHPHSAAAAAFGHQFLVPAD